MSARVVPMAPADHADGDAAELRDIRASLTAIRRRCRAIARAVEHPDEIVWRAGCIDVEVDRLTCAIDGARVVTRDVAPSASAAARNTWRRREVVASPHSGSVRSVAMHVRIGASPAQESVADPPEVAVRPVGGPDHAGIGRAPVPPILTSGRGRATIGVLDMSDAARGIDRPCRSGLDHRDQGLGRCAVPAAAHGHGGHRIRVAGEPGVSIVAGCPCPVSNIQSVA